MLAQWIDKWLESVLVEGGAPRTVETYRHMVMPYLNFLGENATAIGREDVLRYLESLSGIAPATYNLRRTVVCQLHKFLYAEEILKSNPTSDLEPARRRRPLPVVLSTEEIDRLILAARTFERPQSIYACAGLVRRRAMVELLYASGLRISEALGLSVETLCYGREMFLVNGKGGRQRLAPVHAEALVAVDDWLDFRKQLPSRNNPWLFHAAREPRRPLGRTQAFEEIKGLAECAGIHSARLSPHKLRHAFATHLLSNGVDIRVLQELLGHADISTTEIYTHVDLRRSAEMVRDLHPLNDPD